MNETQPPVLPSAPAPQRGVSGWVLFIAVFLAPAVLMAMLPRSSDAYGVVLLLGGGASALFCGIWLARRLFAKREWIFQVVMAVVFTGVFFPVNAVLCCVGCTLGGGELNIH